MRGGKVAKNIDEYLAAVPAEQRAALQKLRRTIHAAAPQATEGIGYGMPVFRHLGMLVGFAAFKNHCSFFPMSAALIAAHHRELTQFETAKGTIRFTPSKPIPAALVKTFARARIQQNEARKKKRESKL